MLLWKLKKSKKKRRELEMKSTENLQKLYRERRKKMRLNKGKKRN
jgi:hypothetical protein